MDLKRAQLLLDKINRLYKSMSLDPENVAQIEKDLMRDYIKLLYGAFLEEPVTTKSPPKAKETRETIATSPVVTPIPKPITTEQRRVTPTPRVIMPPPPAQEVVVETTNQPSYQSRVVTTPSSPQPKPSTALNEEEQQLFALEDGTELSHKLGSLPIADLNKAMGINERIFTINELFRGDSRAFKHTMNALNQLSSFDEAKGYLAKNIINQFEWTKKQRRGNAKNFIKLIKRRYI